MVEIYIKSLGGWGKERQRRGGWGREWVVARRGWLGRLHAGVEAAGAGAS